MHLKQLGKSFTYAWKGVRIVFRSEQNFRIQLGVGVLVMVAALWLALPLWRIVVLVMIITFVLALELVNSVLERMTDAFHPRIHQTVEEMKDIMAAIVLLASVGAGALGVVLFWPYVLVLFS
jgi:diacylglycerol kinase